MKFEYAISVLEVECENLYQQNTEAYLSNKDCDDRVKELSAAIKILKESENK